MYGKHPSNVAIVEDLAPSALALSSWSCWKVGTLPTSGSADGLSQWTLLTLAKFWFQVSNFFWCDFTVHRDMSDWGRLLWNPELEASRATTPWRELGRGICWQEKYVSARNFFGREWDLVEAGADQPQQLDDSDCKVLCINADCIAVDLIMCSHLYTSAADVYGNDFRTKLGKFYSWQIFWPLSSFWMNKQFSSLFTC